MYIKHENTCWGSDIHKFRREKGCYHTLRDPTWQSGQTALGWYVMPSETKLFYYNVFFLIIFCLPIFPFSFPRSLALLFIRLQQDEITHQLSPLILLHFMQTYLLGNLLDLRHLLWNLFYNSCTPQMGRRLVWPQSRPQTSPLWEWITACLGAAALAKKVRALRKMSNFDKCAATRRASFQMKH